MKFANIPIFIPELACPNQCVFCNQKKISGALRAPSLFEIDNIINTYLSTLPDSYIKNIAFFGGNFTGIDLTLQEEYLKTAYKYIENNKVDGIRVSTRPDYINEEILALLKKYNVKTIELGAQSTNNEVLKASGRGHTYDDIKTASYLIKKNGFNLGLQMMVGLPEDNYEKAIRTANDIAELGADNTRIYPTLIIKDTKLAELYYLKKYKPLELSQAINICKDVYKIFENKNINVLRMGLHPSEELEKNDLIAGPYHISFKELVLTELWHELLKDKLQPFENKNIIIVVNNTQINYAIGYNGKNRERLKEEGFKIEFKQDNNLLKYQINVSNS